MTGKRKPPAMLMSCTIAILDKDGGLIGVEKIDQPSKDDIVVDNNIDLPMDGSYQWNATAAAFYPKGRGRGRPQLPPPSSKSVLYSVICELKRLGSPLEPHVLEWKEWYETHLLESDRAAQKRLRRN